MFLRLILLFLSMVENIIIIIIVVVLILSASETLLSESRIEHETGLT
jgi:hypothetical protein